MDWSKKSQRNFLIIGKFYQKFPRDISQFIASQFILHPFEIDASLSAVKLP